MLNRFAIFILIFFIPILFAARITNSAEVYIVAKVNNQIITNLDLNERYRFAIITSKIKVNSPEEANLLKRQLLEKMIDEKLILEDAKDFNISSSDEEVNEEIKKIASDQGKSPAGFKDFFTKNSISYSHYVDQIRSQLAWSKIINEVIAPKLRASDAEVKEAMELRNIETNITQFLLAEIYIPFNYDNNSEIDAKILANKLAEEIRSGKNFKNIVNQFSRSPTAEHGGELGWTSKNDLDPKIYQAIAKLKIGEASDPILMNNGYYLLKVLDKKSTTNHLVDSDIKILKTEILSKKLQVAIKGYLIDLRKKSFVEIGKIPG